MYLLERSYNCILVLKSLMIKKKEKRSNTKNYGSFSTNISYHQPKAQEKRILCSHKYDLSNCQEYMKKSIEERSKFLARNKLCYGYYKPISMTYNIRTCNDRWICQICKEKHSTGLHIYTTPKQRSGDDNSGTSDETQKNVTFKSNCAKFDDVNCSASCNNEIAIMCIIPVKIKYMNKRKIITTYGLLDNCSQGTFLREDIIQN